MCGIFGLIAKAGTVEREQVRHFTDLVSHRGPDGAGIFVRDNVGLGHRRLAILDLTESGAQPMRHCDLPVWITYNGEIYNYIELRSELEALGNRFVTATDTEVLLAAYIAWGVECLNRFNGMWSFAIYDSRINKVLCARDRFGIKPFYYVNTETAFAFGSEIRQLLPFIERRKADAELINDFLVCGLTDHTDRTFFTSVLKLAPGHFMWVDASTGAFQINRFYDLQSRLSADRLDPAQAAEGLRDLLDDAVGLRLRSDVRVGTCLSGGLDSSSVASFAAARNAKVSDRAFCAITAVSEQKSNNEEKYAKEVVDQASLDWIKIEPTYDDFVKNLEDLIDAQEEPFGGPSLMMQYLVMRAARENGVVVLLDGQGGDENLLGYDRYYAAWLLDRLRTQGIGGFARAFREAVDVNDNLTPSRLAMYLFGASSAIVRGLAYRFRYGFLKSTQLPWALKRFARSTFNARAMQVMEITETNLPMLLRFEDKSSMRFGVETRLPFLDYRLVEFAVSLDVGVKINRGWTKWPLRSAVNAILPENVVWRRNKIGFAAPDEVWLDRLTPVMQSAVVKSAFLARFVDVKILRRKFGRLDRGMRWRLYCVAVWSERFVVCS